MSAQHDHGGQLDAHTREVVIDASNGQAHYWSDLWQGRELLLMMIWRDVIVRYKQTKLGFAWAVARPLATMLVFTFVFSRVAHLSSGSTPYPLMVFAGLLPWLFFSSTFSDAGNSVLGNAHIISKVYFPRLLVPASSVAVGLVDFVIAFILYLLLTVLYGHLPSWHLLVLPLYLALLCLLIFGFGLWVAALNVHYRDFRYLVPIALQMGGYLSPIGYSSTLVKGHLAYVYDLNPMVGIIDGFRWCLLGSAFPLRLEAQLSSLLFTLLALLPGIVFFKRAETNFADAI